MLNGAFMLSTELIVIGVVIHLKYPDMVHKRSLIIIAVSLAIITMCVNPTKYWDIYRQYKFLDDIRTSGIELNDFLFNNKLRIGGADYVSLFTYNLIRYLVVKVGNNRLLPFLMTFITYMIWSYITIDWIKEHQMSGNDVIMSMLLSSVLMPFIFVNSGLRNTTAAAIGALAIYNNLYKRHRIIELVFLFFIAFTIHYSMVYVIIVYLLTKVCRTKIAVIILFVWTNVMPLAVRMIRNTSYEILRKMVSSFLIYTGERNFEIDFYVIGVGFVLFALIISLLLKRKEEKNNETMEIEKFIIMMLMNALFNIGYSQIILRPLYTLGVMSTPVLYYMYGRDQIQNENQQKVSILCIFIGLIFVLRVSVPEYLIISYC